MQASAKMQAGSGAEPCATAALEHKRRGDLEFENQLAMALQVRAAPLECQWWWRAATQPLCAGCKSQDLFKAASCPYAASRSGRTSATRSLVTNLLQASMS